jgi:excisionase family DNA binding protein
MITTNRKPRLLTLKEAASLIDGLTEYRVRMLCINGEIKYHMFGNKYMVSEREILNYFGENA